MIKYGIFKTVSKNREFELPIGAKVIRFAFADSRKDEWDVTYYVPLRLPNSHRHVVGSNVSVATSPFDSIEEAGF